MCGEKGVQYRSQYSGEGSPPRVRGKVIEYLIQRYRKGITPACAGKRYLPRFCAQVHRDHPRVCGEKRAYRAGKSSAGGSPPRVRGKVLWNCGKVIQEGITPACAGKSRRRCLRTLRGRDHPRVCGEKSSRCSQGLFDIGSPPRVRGKDLIFSCFLAIARFFAFQIK